MSFNRSGATNATEGRRPAARSAPKLRNGRTRSQRADASRIVAACMNGSTASV